MHLIVEQYGVFVSKHQGRLRVEKDKQRLAEVPIMHLEQVLICSNGVGLSSDVVRACAEEGIPIHFLNGSAGDDYGTLFASGLTGMALTKRAQLRAYEDERLPRTSWVQLQSRRNARLYHDGAAGRQFDADRALRAEKLYDYDALAG